MGKYLSGRNLNLKGQDLKSKCQYLNWKDLNDKDLNLNWQDLRSKCQDLNR